MALRLHPPFKPTPKREKQRALAPFEQEKGHCKWLGFVVATSEKDCLLREGLASPKGASGRSGGEGGLVLQAGCVEALPEVKGKIFTASQDMALSQMGSFPWTRAWMVHLDGFLADR